MKKRVFCNLLVLVLLLGMLPVTALAGGGSSVVWSEDFSDENCWDNWQVADVNHDGFSFVRSFEIVGDPCEMNYSALSAQGYGGQDGVGMDAEEYLISPVIDLQDVYEEYELSFDATVLVPDSDDATPYTTFELYVIDPGTDLSDQGLRNLPYRRFVRENPMVDYGTATYRYDLTAFTDVAPDAFYAKAVAWAVEKEITNGMSPTSFAPENICTRGQVVTFLYRAMGG